MFPTPVGATQPPPLEKVETRLFINGEFVQATGAPSYPLHNPVNGSYLLSVPSASRQDVETAYQAANRAQPGWHSLGAQVWCSLFLKLASLLRENSARLVALESMVMGKPSTAADALRTAPMIENLAGQAIVNHGESSITTSGQMGVSLLVPYGVTAAIVPWNTPILLTLAKLAPALLAGNTMIVKPSERSPLSVIMLAKLFQEAGFPPGVFNIVNGGEEVGTMLSTHPGIRKIAFTGSVETGKKVARASAESNLKNLVLELGGKNPAVIFDDADLEQAVSATEFSLVYNAGQVCMANSRILVQQGIADRFIEAFVQKFTARVPGDPFATGTVIGPLVDRRAYDSVMDYIDEARASGAKVIDARISGAGGSERRDLGRTLPRQAKRRDGSGFEDGGYFVLPTVILDLPNDTRAAKEEIFGPVVEIKTFPSSASGEETLAPELVDRLNEMANSQEYGLYASVFTRSLSTAMKMARLLEAGTVAINQSSPTILTDMPFGGFKQSGWGREFGKESIERWSLTRTVLFKLD
ncbi:aldehyde dehydrogenase [Violaceomyces palustris]|uniref:Aldehyde dehydrogenase n=1 Tax=Violaceomyces palustris TaxID=1673888 RepID=A0ACD0NR92_9BASI|nr:aldehyde dehydrogenase [Violaceomyces palustris]